MDRLFLAIIAAALVTLISSVALVYETAHTAQFLSPRPNLPLSKNYRRSIEEEKALLTVGARR